jgi:hypothetical protein
MTFSVVKGAPDSCGHGCDSWIEAEGQIDSSAAARFKTFLDRVQGRNLPIYLASPGGNLNQAIVIGTMLHAKLIIVRVGRSLVRECGFEAQDSDVCVKLKQSGRELHGDLFTRGAVCASACPYVFAGAAVHEVAPDAVLGIHSPKIVLNFRVDQPDPIAVAEADERGHARADRMVAAYLANLGIDAALLGLTKAVRNEDLHVLTREEIVRFGLDRREFVETPWTFESNARSIVHKIAVVRKPGEPSFRTLQWRVVCFDANGFVLNFLRPAPASSGSSWVSIATGDGTPVYFTDPPAKASGLESWSLRLPLPGLRSLLKRPQVEFTETSLTTDGGRLPQTIKLSNDGWAGALESLLAGCPAAQNSAAAQTSRSGETAAK